jgi:hypothetical protein
VTNNPMSINRSSQTAKCKCRGDGKCSLLQAWKGRRSRSWETLIKPNHIKRIHFILHKRTPYFEILLTTKENKTTISKTTFKFKFIQ